jgi:hypothetical protein
LPPDFTHPLVDIHCLLEAFKGERIWNFNIKLTDGATIFADLYIWILGYGKFWIEVMS